MGFFRSRSEYVDSASNSLEKKSSVNYMQSPIIRNGPIRLSAEFWGKFKKRALGRSNLRNASKKLRNASKKLRNAQCSDFQS